jgi:hypothetical protein
MKFSRLFMILSGWAELFAPALCMKNSSLTIDFDGERIPPHAYRRRLQDSLTHVQFTPSQQAAGDRNLYAANIKAIQVLAPPNICR